MKTGDHVYYRNQHGETVPAIIVKLGTKYATIKGNFLEGNRTARVLITNLEYQDHYVTVYGHKKDGTEVSFNGEIVKANINTVQIEFLNSIGEKVKRTFYKEHGGVFSGYGHNMFAKRK